MAKNITRCAEINQKKALCYMVVDVNSETYADFDDVSLDYLAGYLPKDAVIQNAYVFTQVASNALAVTVGTTDGGTEILSAGDSATLGKTGTFTGETDTGTGEPVYVTLGANPTSGEFQVVIEYFEYRLNTGKYTIMD